MLARLSIQNLLLIERLDLEPHAGLTTLTGETGAGKSILLDALSLSLGARARSDLVRAGAEQASLTSEWQLDTSHPAWDLLEAAEVELDRGENLTLRRVLRATGSRALINDQSVSRNLLQKVGETLVEIQGQFAQHGLLDPKNHLAELDSALSAQEVPYIAATAEAWEALRIRRQELDTLRARVTQLDEERDYLSFNVEELRRLHPEAGEEETLATQRLNLQHRDALLEGLAKSLELLEGDRGAESQTLSAARLLERLNERAGERLTEPLNQLDQAMALLADANASLRELSFELRDDQADLDEVEERLFSLREAARKHQVTPDALPEVLERMSAALEELEDASAALVKLEQATREAEAAYETQALALRKARQSAAERLEMATARELPDLRLAHARLIVRFNPLPEARQGPRGLDQVSFEVQTNPDLPAGPLGKVASGGELSRLMLAMKLALSGAASGLSLVFDEVDAGVGGATAAAVGQRLRQLASQQQILVVTHSPQVAAASQAQWHVAKRDTAEGTRTQVEQLDADARLEELARMLSGSSVSDEGREAARALLVSAEQAH